MAAYAVDAVGILEVRGITASIEAADMMTKSADIEIIGSQKIGNALIYTAIKGKVDAVYAAIQNGKKMAEGLGEVYACTVLPHPCSETMRIIGAISG